MKQIYMILIVSISLNALSYSQGNSYNFTYEEMSTLINKHFIKYSTGQESTTSSSFAAIDLKETEFTFSPIFITKNFDVWNAKFKGGITDGAASLFNNNKFNTNMSVDVQYNLNLTNGRIRVIGYLEEDYVKFRKEKIDCLKKNLSELKEYISKDDKLKNKDYVTRIDNILKQIPDNDVSSNLQKHEELLIKIYNELDEEINTLKDLNDNEKEILLDKFTIWSNRIADASKKRASEFKFTQFKTKWLTLGVSARNDEFRLVNRAETFDNQVQKNNYVSYGAKIQYNSYDYRKYGNTLFYSVGLNFKRKSNFSSLKKIDITENAAIGSNGQLIRTSNDKFTAYEGLYKEDLNQMDIAADFFYFIDRFQDIGLHLYENSRFMDFVKPSHDLGIGVVFPFKKKDSIVMNAEIYYTLKNIFNTKNTTFGLLERNDIGLRFTFPFDAI